MADLFAPLVGERAEQFAESLIARFGGLSAAIRAAPDTDDLSDTERQALSLVSAAQRITNAALAEGLSSSAICFDDDGFKKFLRSSLAIAGEERLLAVFLDSRGHFLRDELLAQGSLRSVPLPIRKLSRRTLELNAAGVILAHNHPSGCDKPSQKDRSVTSRVHAALATLDVDLLDHLIVTREHVFSIRRGERV
jgi:DNA repair protein RadC